MVFADGGWILTGKAIIFVRKGALLPRAVIATECTMTSASD